MFLGEHTTPHIRTVLTKAVERSRSDNRDKGVNMYVFRLVVHCIPTG